MKWFINVFLKSFNNGETRISEKQYNIFCKYLKERFSSGYIEGFTGVVDGKTVKAYEWNCVTGRQYFVEISGVTA